MSLILPRLLLFCGPSGVLVYQFFLSFSYTRTFSGDLLYAYVISLCYIVLRGLFWAILSILLLTIEVLRTISSFCLHLRVRLTITLFSLYLFVYFCYVELYVYFIWVNSDYSLDPPSRFLSGCCVYPLVVYRKYFYNLFSSATYRRVACFMLFQFHYVAV